MLLGASASIPSDLGPYCLQHQAYKQVSSPTAPEGLSFACTSQKAFQERGRGRGEMHQWCFTGVFVGTRVSGAGLQPRLSQAFPPATGLLCCVPPQRREAASRSQDGQNLTCMNCLFSIKQTVLSPFLFDILPPGDLGLPQKDHEAAE